MTGDDLKLIGGILLPAIPINLTLINFYFNDKIKNPIRLAIVINLIYAAIGGYIVYKATTDLFAGSLIGIENAVLLVVIFYLLKQRDLKGIKFAEEIINANQLIDVQTSYVLSTLLHKTPALELKKTITNGLNYILSLLGELLGLEKGNKQFHYSLSILLANDNGKFQVLAYQGISPLQTKKIEESFQYKSKIVSVAGYAANKGIIVCIHDLSDQSLVENKYWIATDKNENQEGFLYCYPLLYNTGKNNNTATLAVVCISSNQKDMFDCKVAKDLLDRFAPKIEHFIYIYKLRKFK